MAELFIQTAAERESELARLEEDEQINAMLKLLALSKKDIENGDVMSPEDVLIRRNGERS